MKQKGRGDAVSSTSCGLSRSGCLLQRGRGRPPATLQAAPELVLLHGRVEDLSCRRSWRREDEERVALHGSSSRGLSRQAYLLQWAYKAAAHPQAALEHMLLLGYRGEPSALFSVSTLRRQERKPEAAKRGTFQVRRATSGTSSMHLLLSRASEKKREGTI